MEVFGITRSDGDALARMLAAFESGSLGRRTFNIRGDDEQRVYETVPFINAAGEAIPAYALMRQIAPTTVEDEKIINVAKPDATYRWRYLVNGPEEVPAASGSRGWGTYVFDSDKILYDTAATPTVDEEWGPKSGEWKLFQHRPGFILDGRFNTTDGVLWAMQRPPTHVLGRAEVSIHNAASGTVRVYGGTPGSETDTGQTIASCYNRGRYIYDEEFVRVFLENGKPYVLPASGSTLLLGKTDAAIAKGASGTVSIWTDAFGADTTDNVTARNDILSITAASKIVYVHFHNGSYVINPCECPV